MKSLYLNIFNIYSLDLTIEPEEICKLFRVKKIFRSQFIFIIGLFRSPIVGHPNGENINWITMDCFHDNSNICHNYLCRQMSHFSMK